jgi:hypothetical protein
MKFAGGMSYVVLSPALANGNRVEAMDPRDQELKEAIRGSLKNLEERLSELH